MTNRPAEAVHSGCIEDDGAEPTPVELTLRILRLGDVDVLVADEESGAPQISWGDRFFFVGPDRRRPFATIVEHDVPGFDQDSQLHRDGIFRLNIDVGRAEFQRLFGFRPAELADHRHGTDFSAVDVLLPHPAYGTYGWASILNPGRQRLADVDRLLADAHRRAAQRHQRSRHRRRPASQPGEQA